MDEFTTKRILEEVLTKQLTPIMKENSTLKEVQQDIKRDISDIRMQLDILNSRF